jgi:hypothetical protein
LQIGANKREIIVAAIPYDDVGLLLGSGEGA